MLFSSTRPRDGGSDPTGQRRAIAALALLAWLLPTGAMAYAARDSTTQGVAPLESAIGGSMRLAQAQPLPPPSATPARPATPPTPAAAPAASATQGDDQPIGNVATLTGTASVIRSQNTLPLKVKDDIYLNDVVVTFADSTLGITFNDETTFHLNANASITIDNFVYESGGKQNAALFDVTKGTVAFVASAVARTGDMKIATPTATLGIRGTTGLVEVNGAGSGAHNIKLYPDADGRVGHIDISDRSGVRLGSLTQGSSGFTLRSGPGGRITAAPLVISPQQAARDQGIVRQVHAAQVVGRQVVGEQRALRRANPNRVNPNSPRNLRNAPRNAPAQPGQRQNNLQPRPNTPQQPGQPNRAGESRPGGQPGQPGAPNRATQQGQQPPAVERPNAPALHQGGVPNRGAPAPKRAPGPKGKKEKRR
jgi:FecR protein